MTPSSHLYNINVVAVGFVVMIVVVLVGVFIVWLVSLM